MIKKMTSKKNHMKTPPWPIPFIRMCPFPTLVLLSHKKMIPCVMIAPKRLMKKYKSPQTVNQSPIPWKLHERCCAKPLIHHQGHP